MRLGRTGIIVGIVLATLAAAQASAGQLGKLGQLGKVSDGMKKVGELRDLQVTDADEQRLGQEVSQRIRERYGVVQSAPVHRYVSLVGRTLAAASTRPALPWTFIVLDTDGVNAFAAPGGYVHITRGALALMQDEAELAGVLAHEILHVTEKHTIRSIQKTKAVQMGASETLSGNAALLDRVVSVTYESIVERGFGREDERESDAAGAALTSRVGYRPAALRSFLTRLKERNAASTERRGLFASHPDMQSRLDAITRAIDTQKLAGTVTLPERFRQTITYTPTPLTDIATVDPGAAGLTGGDSKGATPKPEEKDNKDAPKRRSFGLGRMLPGSGGEKTQAQVTGSGAARGVDPERDARGGSNPALVAVSISAGDLQAFRKAGGLIAPGV
jgi:Zn-dependent protease with chaperone function